MRVLLMMLLLCTLPAFAGGYDCDCECDCDELHDLLDRYRKVINTCEEMVETHVCICPCEPCDALDDSRPLPQQAVPLIVEIDPLPGKHVPNPWLITPLTGPRLDGNGWITGVQLGRRASRWSGVLAWTHSSSEQELFKYKQRVEVCGDSCKWRPAWRRSNVDDDRIWGAVGYTFESGK
jgi:hypothetical protein